MKKHPSKDEPLGRAVKVPTESVLNSREIYQSITIVVMTVAIWICTFRVYFKVFLFRQVVARCDKINKGMRLTE
jgi:hypothetical protein